ncbi:hypothetical protein EDD11_000295, partial [Mortierella claussenii]
PSYNITGLLAYFLPMVASIDQLVVIMMTDLNGNARLLSFSVLAVFVNMLYELRVIKMVCKYVTIIQRAVAEILAFFIIFGVGIATFTIAILHVLHACPVDTCTRDPDSGYPTQFFGALTSTFFFMAGRFGPINDELSSQDWGFHVMMIFCYLFTNIVMMNVLISLFSMTFIKGDDCWRLTWIDCRLRYIESAENMSYHVQGFRETHDYFPKEIYYTADPLKVTAFHERRLQKAHSAISANAENAKMTGASSAVTIFKSLFVKRDNCKDKLNEQNGTTSNNNCNMRNNEIQNEKREQMDRETKADLSAIVAALTEMQHSIQELKATSASGPSSSSSPSSPSLTPEIPPKRERDPKATAAYERAQARDLVEHWISGRDV